MFNPIVASKEIKDEFISYISTLFHISDKDYEKKFIDELQKEGMITKGPYLELNDSYKKGVTLAKLIEENEVSPLFNELEDDIADKNKEIQLNRELFLHQEEAIRKINSNHNLIVTTGTGSGKTECFIIPIINELLREKEANKLTSGVRAILIYPMNALANDQMKRLRKLLKNYPDITFGVYNGNTKHGETDARSDFENNSDEPLLPNEVISRETMQKRPPHILVTNYSMLEYMLLRPKDDVVFSGANLRFIVLDEAHIYRGAKGIETSLLLKRLKARICNSDNVLHILTSATLGDKSSDNDIVKFAKSLCNADFMTYDIIRSETIVPSYSDNAVDLPLALFADLADPREPLNSIAGKYNIKISEGQSDSEFLYELCCKSAIYRKIREIVDRPMKICEITEELNKFYTVSEQDIINIISIAVQGSKNNTALVKARYHLFAKALEGAYITLSPNKELFLTRNKEYIDGNETKWKVFECACCDDCGELAILGQELNGKLEFANNSYNSNFDYYLINKDENYFLDDDDNQLDENSIGENDYILCAHCGAIVHKSNGAEIKCNCKNKCFVNIRKLNITTKSHEVKCSHCGSGKIMPFYLGYDAATAVLGTTLYEQIPEIEVKLASKTTDTPPKKSLFKTIKTRNEANNIDKKKQFLAFSDSRSEAAYFASYMEKSYQEFLRRRGIWHVVEKHKQDLIYKPWEIIDFVKTLTAYFDKNRTFAKPGDEGIENLTAISKKNAWIAILNEMVNAKRGNSLSSLGIIKFHFKGNDFTIMQDIAERYNKKPEDMMELFDLLVLDIVHNGILEGDDYDCDFTGDEREYVYYTPIKKYIKKCKDSASDKNNFSVIGWLPSSYKNKKIRKNNRLKRIMKTLNINETEAIEILEGYWDYLSSEKYLSHNKNDNYSLLTDKFTISAVAEIDLYICDKCGKVTTHNCLNKCSIVTCDGKLIPISQQEVINNNHYAKLYRNTLMKPLHIKEHTAQLGRIEQQNYQDMFRKNQLNALSCSTTFEMGVDLGDLETIYLRNVPPSPSNYVQRAGRAGRRLSSAAFALTYAKMSSHDYTYYNHPEDMITGKIGVPLFEVSNEKIILRHIFAVTLSEFFRCNEDVYNSNNADIFLNENGYERLCEYLNSKPDELKNIIELSIPSNMHKIMGIPDFSWVNILIGENGILKNAIEDFRETVAYYINEIERLSKLGEVEQAGSLKARLRNFRRSKNDGKGENELIDFLVRNNILPKYGFPVDAVELYQNINSTKDVKKLSLNRDLQIAIYEYAPDAQIVADGKLYTSRYIRKLMAKTGQNWEICYIAKCQNDSCNTWNHRIIKPNSNSEKCISCNSVIEDKCWREAIEPRRGFIADTNPKDVPMHKPDRTYRSDDYYIGGDRCEIMENKKFITESDYEIELESSKNDSLMVVCNDDFYVCKLCGYSESVTQNKASKEQFNSNERYITRKHKDPWGKDCDCENLNKYKLCHVFKTDVVKIVFNDVEAKKYETMLSVMYALLQAISSVLDIERNDIKGCLHGITYKNRFIYSIILYDAVAGGAGHVRRLITDSGDRFTKVVNKAIEITKNCDCSPSCYNCLRNYYNQRVHDKLDRKSVYDFLEKYSGKLKLVD